MIKNCLEPPMLISRSWLDARQHPAPPLHILYDTETLKSRSRRSAQTPLPITTPNILFSRRLLRDVGVTGHGTQARADINLDDALVPMHHSFSGLLTISKNSYTPTNSLLRTSPNVITQTQKPFRCANNFVSTAIPARRRIAASLILPTATRGSHRPPRAGNPTARSRAAACADPRGTSARNTA